MAKDDIKSKAITNFAWKLFERIGAQFVSFLVQLVLARILMPEDFGTIAIVNVAISIGNVLITNGLGTSLIQKKDADELDFSSMFYFNIFFSLILYLILFFVSPVIANIYKDENLVLILRILGLQIFISAVKTIQQAFVARSFRFKDFFKATLIGTIISGIVGIVAAYCGFGVWALVLQHLLNSFIDMFALFIITKWRPINKFSINRLKPLLSYSWKLLGASLIDTIYNEIRTLIIGIKYTSEDLGFYNKGKQFPDLVCDNILVSVESVLFPVMSKFQDQKEDVKKILTRFIEVSSYLMTPLLVGLFITADSLVPLLLTEKWNFCIPFIRIYCIVNIFKPIQTANIQMVKALGRSDITIIVEIIKKIIGLAIVILSMNYGVLVIAASNIVYSIIILFVNSFPSRKLVNYSTLQQLKDFSPSFFLSVIMGIIIYPIELLGFSPIICLILQVLLGILIYLIASIITKNSSFTYIMNYSKEFVGKNFKKKNN